MSAARRRSAPAVPGALTATKSESNARAAADRETMFSLILDVTESEVRQIARADIPSAVIRDIVATACEALDGLAALPLNQALHKPV